MFSKTQTYSYSGCALHVLHNTDTDLEIESPIQAHVKTDDGQIYLGHFLSCVPVVWRKETVQDGLAIFEFGKVEFPNFREIRIWIKEPPCIPFFQ